MRIFVRFFLISIPVVFGFMSLLSWFQMRDNMCALYGFLCLLSMAFAGVELR